MLYKNSTHQKGGQKKQKWQTIALNAAGRVAKEKKWPKSEMKRVKIHLDINKLTQIGPKKRKYQPTQQ
jgi:aspartyl aminopeptidase